jgi:hypothetical protein
LLPRPKTSRILKNKPALRAMLAQDKYRADGKTMFMPKQARVSSVVVKLAQGHALYEIHESCAREPNEFSCVPLELLGPDQRLHFENPETSSVWPEVGRRALQRLVEGGSDVSPSGWINVQPGRYRFHVSLGNGIEIRLVIHEYLACYVQWE